MNDDYESVVRQMYPNAIHIADYNECDFWSVIYDGVPTDDEYDDYGTSIGWGQREEDAWKDAAKFVNERRHVL